MDMENSGYFSKQIYEKGNIKQAIRDFGAISELNLHENEDYFSLEIFTCKTDKGLLLKEFENYLIGISGKNGY